MEQRIITQEQLYNFNCQLKDEEKSILTIQKYDRDIRYFLSFLSENPITKEQVIQYKTCLSHTFSTASANSMLAALNSFFRYLGWADFCVKPFRMQRPAYCSDQKELTKDEYFRLIRTAERKGKEKLSLIIQTLCSCGLRVSELPFVTVESIQNHEIIVQCNGKFRTVFLVDKLCKKLLKYAKKNHITSGPIFITKLGKPMNRSNIWREMKRLCADAGVAQEKVFPHNLRHLFARIFYEAEKDIVALADVLGHSNLNTTRIYTITTGAEHKKRIEHMRLII